MLLLQYEFNVQILLLMLGISILLRYADLYVTTMSLMCKFCTIDNEMSKLFGRFVLIRVVCY